MTIHYTPSTIITETVSLVLRPHTQLTVPEIWQAVGWKYTVQEISESLDELRRQGLAEFAPLKDSGSQVPAWRKGRGK